MEYKTLKELDLQPGDVVRHMGSDIITYVVDHPENHPNHPCPIYKEKGLVAIGYDGINPVRSFQSVDSSCNKSWYLISRKEEEVSDFKVGDLVCIVSNESYSRHPVGTVGYITEFSCGEVRVSPDNLICEGGNLSMLSEITHVEYEEESHSAKPEDTLPKFAKILYQDSSVVVYRKVKESKVVTAENVCRVTENGKVYFNVGDAGKIKITCTTIDGVLTDVKAEIV